MTSDDIDAVAADWLARLDRQDWPTELRHEFEAWCRADPRHYAAYLRLQTIWDRLDGLREAPPTQTSELAPRGVRLVEVICNVSVTAATGCGSNEFDIGNQGRHI